MLIILDSSQMKSNQKDSKSRGRILTMENLKPSRAKLESSSNVQEAAESSTTTMAINVSYTDTVRAMAELTPQSLKS